jgi:internalin A
MTPKEQQAYNEALHRIKTYCSDEIGVLDISGLKLTRLPPEIGQLTALTDLYLNDNQLITLPPEIGNLTALTELRVQGNHLTTLPPTIPQLTKLLRLYLSNNQLTTLPPEVGQFTALKTLTLHKNHLIVLPPEIGGLKELQHFYLDENHFRTLPPEIGKLTELRDLDLSNNRLTTLPMEIGQLKELRGLYLHGNPALGLPEEILGPDWNAVESRNGKPAKPQEILEYYFAILGAAGQALREVKLILVGRGEVGKSSMADALLGRKFVKNRKRTDGIAITPWEVKLSDGAAKVQIWDFGGQEIMHGTHQFFLTHRSLYVVMVDGRHDRAKQDAEYWLKLVRAFGGDSRVLVVMNRQMAHPFDMDRQYLADKYGVALDHFFRTDCSDAKSIGLLRKIILAQAGEMLAAEERFPRKCWDVKTRLEEMQKRGEDYLSDEAYADICKKHGVEDEEEQRKLLRRLADLGTVVSFPDEVKLSELTVLNPSWATDGIYRVVTDEELKEKRHGQLQSAALRKILPHNRWPKPAHVRYVLDLMEKFELCFSVGDDKGSVLVPDILPDKTPPLADWDATQCVVFSYRYTVLPHGVLPRFITRTHEFSRGGERWRSGVVLVHDGAEALIKADYDINCISVWVRGDHADARRGLLKVVRSHFDQIHARIKELNPQEQVAVPGRPTVLVPYCDLVLDERRGKTEYPVTVQGERVDWSIGNLLNGVESPAERKKAQKRSDREMGARHVTVAPGAHYHEHEETMNDNTINARDIINSQVGQVLTSCTNMIQQQPPGERRNALEDLEKEAKALIAKLPEDKKQEAAGNLELAVKGATSTTPNRKWYSVSAEGLIDASKFVKDFSGNIVGTLGTLGKLLWADFSMPEGEKER